MYTFVDWDLCFLIGSGIGTSGEIMHMLLLIHNCLIEKLTICRALHRLGRQSLSKFCVKKKLTFCKLSVTRHQFC
jgi:hypothetical protein